MQHIHSIQVSSITLSTPPPGLRVQYQVCTDHEFYSKSYSWLLPGLQINLNL